MGIVSLQGRITVSNANEIAAHTGRRVALSPRELTVDLVPVSPIWIPRG